MADDWKIDRIDTTNVAKAFAEELKGEAKTYFLQGSWGSGKTEYLKEVEKAMNGGKKHFKPFKFVYLELWKPKNKASLAQNILETIHPILYWLKTFAYVALILVSVIASTYISAITIIQKQLSSKEKIWIVILACLIMAFIAHYQNNFFDMDRMVMWIDRKSLQGKHIFRKVLIVDDFDRLDKEMQDELYLFFNQLNGQARIIFVGDFSKISKNQDNYLSKIIDRQIGLPMQLQSNNIVNLIKKKIRIELDKIDDPNANYNGFLNTRDSSFYEVEKMFINEKRTARDANQYLGYIQNQLITRNKLDRVDLDQELFVIYLYLFHLDNYNTLLHNYYMYNFGYNYEDKSKENEISKIDELINYVLYKPNHMLSFKKNPAAYVIDDLATNHSVEELVRIARDKEKIKKYYFSDRNSADYQELYDFVDSDIFVIIYYPLMFETAIEVVSSSEYEKLKKNDLIKLVLQKYATQLYEKNIYEKHIYESDYNVNQSESVILQFEEFFNNVQKKNKCKISTGERLYIYRELIGLFEFVEFHYDDYAQSYLKRLATISKNESDFGKAPHDAEVLLYILDEIYDGTYSEESPTIESQAEAIEKLCDTEYLYFWKKYLGYTPKSIKRVDYKNLDFLYKGQIYADYVLSRCRTVLNK